MDRVKKVFVEQTLISRKRVEADVGPWAAGLQKIAQTAALRGIGPVFQGFETDDEVAELQRLGNQCDKLLPLGDHLVGVGAVEVWHGVVGHHPDDRGEAAIDHVPELREPERFIAPLEVHREVGVAVVALIPGHEGNGVGAFGEFTLDDRPTFAVGDEVAHEIVRGLMGVVADEVAPEDGGWLDWSRRSARLGLIGRGETLPVFGTAQEFLHKRPVSEDAGGELLTVVCQAGRIGSAKERELISAMHGLDPLDALSNKATEGRTVVGGRVVRFVLQEGIAKHTLTRDLEVDPLEGVVCELGVVLLEGLDKVEFVGLKRGGGVKIGKELFDGVDDADDLFSTLGYLVKRALNLRLDPGFEGCENCSVDCSRCHSGESLTEISDDRYPTRDYGDYRSRNLRFFENVIFL